MAWRSVKPISTSSRWSEPPPGIGCGSATSASCTERWSPTRATAQLRFLVARVVHRRDLVRAVATLE